MNRITYENNAFIFSEGEKKTVLFCCDDFLSNKSRLPMHSFDDSLTIPKLIVNLINANIRYFENHEEKALTFATSLVDILTASFASKTSLPVKVLELGATDGIISFHLASLLGKLHPETLLCCVTDTIGNDSDNQWLDRIILAEEPPQLSLLASEYDKTQLQGESFDIVVINGMVNFMNPYQVVLEAKRLVKKQGLIICCSLGTPLLESCFKMVFKDRTEYAITEASKIMTVFPGKEGKGDKAEEVGCHEEIFRFIDMMSSRMKDGGDVDLEKSMMRIQQLLGEAAELKDVDAKIQLIRLKEELLDYALDRGLLVTGTK